MLLRRGGWSRLLFVILLPIAASEPWKEGSRSWPGRRGSEPWNRGKPWDLGDSGSGGPLATKVIHMKGIDSQRSVTVQEGRVGLVYRNVSSVHAEFHYVYRVKLDSYPPKTLRLRTEVGDYSSTQPLRVTVRFDKGALNWHVPYEAAGLKYKYVERTLCLHGEDQLDLPAFAQEVTVIISTSSAREVPFSINLYDVHDFSTGLNKKARVDDVTVSSPVFRYVDLLHAEDNSLLNVRVDSTNEDICAIVSVQPFNCPVSDIEETIRNEGSFQTMLKIASFNIERNEYGDGVYVVFAVLSDDALCGSDAFPTRKRVKDFSFEITDDLSKEAIAGKVAISVTFLVGLGLITVIAHCLFSVYGEKHQEKKLKRISQNTETCLSSERINGVNIINIRQKQSSKAETRFSEVGPHEEEHVPAADDCESMNANNDQTDHKMHNENVVHSKLPKYVDELSRKGHDRDQQKLVKTMFQKSDLYIWLVITMGIFYAIPAIQVVINQQNKLKATGDQDICYYNFLCSIPVNAINDFNHIFSNIWYMGFGLLFVFLTWHRHYQHTRFLERLKEDGISPTFGIPQHFGIFYAMGIAIIFEGILSACYHVCPTNENFQFDTTFMYVIATLSFIKIYQFRHPDIAVNSYKVFLGLGVVMFTEVIGIYFESTLFWVISLIGYFLVCVILTSIFYHSGQWSLNHNVFPKIYKSLAKVIMTRECSENYSTKRLAIVLLLNGLNISLIIIGAVYRPGIATYLLGVFIGNLIFYTAYYVAMKIIHREKFTIKPIGYAIAAVSCWVPALYYFNLTQYSSEVTPAESRNINQECLVGGMSDSHDIWHMMSAAGMFFTFMMIQTLDDGLFYKPRSKIHIF